MLLAGPEGRADLLPQIAAQTTISQGKEFNLFTTSKDVLSLFFFGKPDAVCLSFTPP